MTDLAALTAALRKLLGPGIGVGVTDPCIDYAGLYPVEEGAAARMIPRRRLEYAAGRAAARAAMADLGLPPAAIPMGDDRAPIWPDGLVGSIAHCKTACIAAVAWAEQTRSIGIDIEEATPLAPDLWETVCTPAEHAWLATQPADRRGLLAKVIFSAKEAVYKAQYPLSRELIGFQEVEIGLTNTGFIASLSGTPAGARLPAI